MYAPQRPFSMEMSFEKPCLAKYPTALLSAYVRKCERPSSLRQCSLRWFIIRVP